MARIETYPFDRVFTINDKVLGTDGDSLNATKNYNLLDFLDYLGTQYNLQSVDLVYTYNAVADTAVGNGEISSNNYLDNPILASGITNLYVSKVTAFGQLVEDYINTVGSNNLNIMFVDLADYNNFGIYEITANSDVNANTISLTVTGSTVNGSFTTGRSVGIKVGIGGGGGGVNTNIYNQDGALTGARTVTMAANQITWSGTGGDIFMNSGRLGVQTPVFGGSRLGDSEFQAANIDVQSINFKDTGQLSALAIFFSSLSPSDGYVTTMKNFVDDVNVISVNGRGNVTAFGAASREVESTVGLRNDFSGGEFRVFDFFNNDYDAATEVAEAQGWVAIHGGGATPKKIGLWRYDTTTYTPIWEVDINNNWILTQTAIVKSNINPFVDGSSNLGNDLTRFNNIYQNKAFVEEVIYTPTDTEPSTPVKGFTYFDDSEATIRLYNGTEWESLAKVDGGGGMATLAVDSGCAANTVSDLLTYTIPASSLADGGMITFEGRFEIAASISTDQIGIKIDGGAIQGITNAGGSTATSIYMHGHAVRSGAGIRFSFTLNYGNGTVSTTYDKTGLTFTNTIDFVIAGGGTTGIAADDVVLKNAFIKQH